MSEEKTRLKVTDLNQMYLDGETADHELFAEQRSNILLVAGEHYSRRNSRYWNKLRQSRDLSDDQKIRLTKNHIHRITRNYVNNIVTYAPGVAVVAKNENEIQDQKAAELNDSVWQDIKQRHKINEKISNWANDFVDIGECFVKIFYDPNLGKLKGYEQEVDENGVAQFDTGGNPVASDRAVFSGDIVYERLYGFNILRPKEAKSFGECQWLMLRKMVSKKLLKKQYDGQEDKLKFIQESSDQTYKIFEGTRITYSDTSKDEVLVMETYMRPGPEYPSGYFFIHTKEGILEEGELPFGLFPIKYVGWDEIQTSPRSRGIIKQLRPYQAEVNRSASKMAEHQVTLGDDKLLIQNGTKLSQGGILPGVRGVTYTGMTPTILAGRSGDQYLSYMQSQIAEMYDIADMEFDSQEKENAQVDPYTLLFQSLRNKKKFSLYAQKFENFLVEICEMSLEIAKYYFDESMLIPAIGKREYINMPEFKNSNKLCYQIKLLPQTDDIESKMGKQMVLQHLIQYAGTALGPEQMGKIIKMMPYANDKEIFDDLTIDYDNARNDILAMDRGQYRPPNKYDNHEYMVKKLVNRMKQPDFFFLNPMIQQMYEQKKTDHEQALAQQTKEIQMAEAGFIPTGGYMVVCDIYVADPANPEKTRRARIPYEALNWLLEKLESQGSSQEQLGSQDPQVQADIAGMLGQLGGGGQQPPPQLAG